MRTTIINCDCCNKKIDSHDWSSMPGKFEVKSHCTSKNPLGHLKEQPGYQTAELIFEEACQDCQRALCQSIADTLKKIRTNP